LPVDDDLLRDVVEVGPAAPEKLTGLSAELLQKVLGILPLLNTIDVPNVLWLNLFENGVDILRRIGHFLSSAHALQYLIGVRLILIVHDTRTIDQIDPLRQSEVLPCLCFAWDRSYFATGLLHEGVDDRALACVRISYQSNTDVLLIFMKNIKLFQ